MRINDNHSRSRKLTDRAGLVTIALLFVLAVSISSQLLRGIRLDLTENKLYTLSAGTLRILESLDEPITLRLYYSATASGDKQLLRGYAQRAETLLKEFAAAANGRIRVQLIDPVPFTNEEDEARMLGLTAVYLDADPIYLGITGSNSTDGSERIPFLDMSREMFLEYDLARMVYSLANQSKPVIGLLSTLPITGGYNPATGLFEAPWSIITQIETLFELRTLDADSGNLSVPIDSDISLLLIVQPKQLSDATLYAIEQFLFRGGRALLFLDPFAESSTGADKASDFALLQHWGIDYQPDMFVGDALFALPVIGEDQTTWRHAGLLGIEASGLSDDNVISLGITSLNLGFAGSLSANEEASSVQLSPLIQSSRSATLLPATLIPRVTGPADLRTLIREDSTPKILAGIISGSPTSAFPAANDAHLQQALTPISLFVAADTDMLTDRYWAQVQNQLGHKVIVPFAGNADFVTNVLDNLSGSDNLIGMRSRAVYTRPFTEVAKLREHADSRFRQRRDELENELAITEQRLNALQDAHTDESGLISQNHQAEINRFIAQRLRIRKDMRQIQRNLNEDIETLGTRLKLVNILLMPMLVAIIGITIAVYRRQRNKAWRQQGREGLGE
ncbi:MAG: Gldg family protein [Gammaproteobacteria bacterium]|nr:Gldg family protein [Gammaproteobacteria bacterium]